MVAVLMAAATTMHAQTSATATANILTALGVTNDTDLDFGDIVPDAASSEVTIAATDLGARTLTSGSAVLVTTNEGNSAQFTLSGEDQAVDLALVSSPITLTGTGSDMSADLVLSETSVGSASGDVFYVGGTLTVGAAQAAGSYSGTFEVTASYQ